MLLRFVAFSVENVVGFHIVKTVGRYRYLNMELMKNKFGFE